MGSPRSTAEYALYHGDEFVMIGTIEELAERQGCTVKSMKWWTTPTGRKRSLSAKDQSRTVHVIKLDDEEEEEIMVAKQEKPELTVFEIENLRNLGESWELIGKRMGVTGVTAKNRYERMKGEPSKADLKEVKKQPNHTVDEPSRLDLIRQLESRDEEIKMLKSYIIELEKKLEHARGSRDALLKENEELDRFNAELMERDKQNKNRIHNLEGAIEDERDRKDRELLSVRNQETEVSEYWRGEVEAEKKSRRLLECLIECKIREWEATAK